jgi:hypothetical protein
VIRQPIFYIIYLYHVFSIEHSWFYLVRKPAYITTITSKVRCRRFKHRQFSKFLAYETWQTSTYTQKGGQKKNCVPTFCYLYMFKE